MQTLKLTQGSQEWLDVRAKYFTASEAPMMMGESPYKTRSQLIHEKKTGERPEINGATQAIFDRGHNAEAKARSMAEKIIDEDLFPLTAIDDSEYLLASFDGVTMLGDLIWEHKLWNKDKAESVRSGNVPDCDLWQVVHQLVVSGAEKCLYMVSDGTEDNMVHCWLTLDLSHEAKLINGWKQFEADKNDYIPSAPKVEVVADAIDNLPTLFIDIEGGVKDSNIATVKDAAIARINAIKTDLTTDKDFADADATVKFLDAGEKTLESAKAQALAKTSSIEELFRTIDDLKESMRSKRLELSKLVAARKKAVKYEVAEKASRSLQDFVADLNAGLGGNYVVMTADLNSAMKGKRTVDTLQGAADDEIAKRKIEATNLSTLIRANLALIAKSEENGYSQLFADKSALVMKPTEDLESIIIGRVADHKAELDRIAARDKASQEAQDLRQGEKEDAVVVAPDPVVVPEKKAPKNKTIEALKVVPESFSGSLSNHQAGFIEGIKAYAYEGNGGVMYVGRYSGADTVTLDSAIAKFLEQSGAAA